MERDILGLGLRIIEQLGDSAQPVGVRELSRTLDIPVGTTHRVLQALKREVEGLDLNALRMIVYASVLIALMIWRPEGLLGEREIGQKKGPASKPPDQERPADAHEPARIAP